MTVALRIADKFHGAILIVQSFPWSPDVLSIVNIIANEDGEPSAGTEVMVQWADCTLHPLQC